MLISTVQQSESATCTLWKRKFVVQSYLTLCDTMDYSPPGSSDHGILQARLLDWVTIPFSRGSSQPRDQAQVSWRAGRFFTIWATREAGTYTCISFLLDFLPIEVCMDNESVDSLLFPFDLERVCIHMTVVCPQVHILHCLATDIILRIFRSL